MSDFTQTINYPDWALGQPDVRQVFRDVVGHRMRRGMQRIADEAAGNTPFDHIAEAYKVEQESVGETLVMSVTNTDEHFFFVEENMPEHEVPPVSAPVAPFEEWVENVGASVSGWYARNKVALLGFHHPGTKGHHMLEEAWDSEIVVVEASIEEGLDILMQRWGAGE
jgi:hypothetical protein